jgi:hypothetical protein
VFTRCVERLAAGDQYLQIGGGPQQNIGKRGAGVDYVFAGVHDE